MSDLDDLRETLLSLLAARLAYPERHFRSTQRPPAHAEPAPTAESQARKATLALFRLHLAEHDELLRRRIRGT